MRATTALKLLTALQLLTVLAVSLTTSAASAQTGTRVLAGFVSNRANDWDAGQQRFDPNAPVQLYVTTNAPNTTIGLTCVVQLAATGQEVARVRVDPIRTGQRAMVASQGTQVSWPNAATSVTCVPDGNAGGAFTWRIVPNNYAQAPSGDRAAQPQPAGPTGPERCRTALIASGGHSSFISRCEGVDGACAEALLETGGHPSFLSRCRNVEPTCATALLRANQHPSFLSRCTPDVVPECATALFSANQHPSFVDRCRGVNAQCAVALLSGGRHPSHLSQCRR